MKRKLTKIFRAFIWFIGLLLLIILIAYLWPMPTVIQGQQVDKLLIRSINIIDLEKGEILQNHNLWIEDNRIVTIDSVPGRIPKGEYEVIEGKGKFLIPGLWDMHTHSTQHSPWLHHPLYIANGVTAIRDMSGQLGRKDSYWAGTRERQSWNQDLVNKEKLGPRYVLHSSYQINGPNSVPDGFENFFKVEDKSAVDSLLAYYQQEGSDFIKVYSEIPANSYRQLVKEADSYGLHVAGHKPLSIPLSEALNAGQRSFEHPRIFLFECFPGADTFILATDKRQAYKKFKKEMISQFDTVKAKALMRKMYENDAYWVPTLQVIKSAAFAHDENFIKDQRLQYIPAMRKLLWWDPDINRAAKDNLSPESRGVNMALYNSARKQILMAYNEQVRMMAGTDVTDSYSFPGFSLHDEIRDLKDSGLSELEALRTATIYPSIYSGRNQDLGSIRPGYLADLLILEANPLEEISNTKKISGVLISGLYFDKNQLEKLKEDTAALASSFHMNVKFVIDLFRSPLMRKQFAD